MQFIFEKIRFFLTHKSPKFSWNASIVLEGIQQNQKTSKNENGKISKKIEEIVPNLKDEIIDLFLSNDNLKLKSYISKVIEDPTFILLLSQKEVISILKFIEKLLDGSWESTILADYKETKNINSLKASSIKIAIRIVKRLEEETQNESQKKKKTKALNQILRISGFFFRYLRKLMDSMGVEYASVNEETAKMVYKKTIEFEEEKGSDLNELLEAFVIIRDLVEEDDEVSYSLNKLDMMEAIVERKKLENGRTEMKNIFKTEFVNQD